MKLSFLDVAIRKIRKILDVKFYQIGVLKNFAKFTGKHMIQSFLFIKKECVFL